MYDQLLHGLTLADAQGADTLKAALVGGLAVIIGPSIPLFIREREPKAARRARAAENENKRLLEQERDTAVAALAKLQQAFDNAMVGMQKRDELDGTRQAEHLAELTKLNQRIEDLETFCLDNLVDPRDGKEIHRDRDREQHRPGGPAPSPA